MAHRSTDRPTDRQTTQYVSAGHSSSVYSHFTWSCKVAIPATDPSMFQTVTSLKPFIPYSLFCGFGSFAYTKGRIFQFACALRKYRGPDCAVGIATGHGLDDPGSNPGGGEIIRTCPDRPWSPPSLLYNGYRVFPGGKAAEA